MKTNILESFHAALTFCSRQDYHADAKGSISTTIDHDGFRLMIFDNLILAIRACGQAENGLTAISRSPYNRMEKIATKKRNGVLPKEWPLSSEAVVIKQKFTGELNP